MVIAPSIRLRHAVPALALTIAATVLLVRSTTDDPAAQAAASRTAASEAVVGASAPSAEASSEAATGDAAVPPPCVLGSGACNAPDLHAPPGARPRDGQGQAQGQDQLAAQPPGMPQLLEFEAAYCAACATMAPVVTSIVKSCAKASEVVRRVDVGEDAGEALAQHYRVDALPTFLAVDAEGHEVFRKVGVQRPAELASLVAEVSGEDCAAARN